MIRQGTLDKAAEVAAGYVEKKEDVVNLLKQQEAWPSRRRSARAVRESEPQRPDRARRLLFSDRH